MMSSDGVGLAGLAGSFRLNFLKISGVGRETGETGGGGEIDTSRGTDLRGGSGVASFSSGLFRAETKESSSSSWGCLSSEGALNLLPLACSGVSRLSWQVLARTFLTSGDWTLSS